MTIGSVGNTGYSNYSSTGMYQPAYTTNSNSYNTSGSVYSDDIITEKKSSGFGTFLKVAAVAAVAVGSVLVLKNNKGLKGAKEAIGKLFGKNADDAAKNLNLLEKGKALLKGTNGKNGNAITDALTEAAERTGKKKWFSNEIIEKVTEEGKEKADDVAKKSTNKLKSLKNGRNKVTFVDGKPMITVTEDGSKIQKAVDKVTATYENGKKVTMEYADGKLKKSTILDGSEITEKLYGQGKNGNTKITKYALKEGGKKAEKGEVLSTTVLNRGKNGNITSIINKDGTGNLLEGRYIKNNKKDGLYTLIKKADNSEIKQTVDNDIFGVSAIRQNGEIVATRSRNELQQQFLEKTNSAKSFEDLVTTIEKEGTKEQKQMLENLKKSLESFNQ